MGQNCQHPAIEHKQALVQPQEPQTIDLQIEQLKKFVSEMRNKNQLSMRTGQKYINKQKHEEFFGYVEDGQKQGYGQLKKNNDIRYYGYFIDNLPHVKGVLIFSKNHYYIGQFYKGKLHGKGKEVSPNFVFQGEYDQDKKKFGTFSTEQFVYEGSFLDNLFDGYGELSFKNGQKYLGYFIKGQFHGQGVYYDSNKMLLYEGEFRNNLYNGQGKYYWTDGSYYEGGYVDGVKHGEGKYFKSDGQLVHGMWNEGLITSRLKNKDSFSSDYNKQNRSTHSTKIEELQ